MVPAEKFILKSVVAGSTVRQCLLCKHFEIVRPKSGAGRGYGMREGNKARGRMIKHVNEAHPEALKAEGQP